MIRLIATDMDDTLLDENLEISEKNRQAIRKAEDAGITVVLASGRSPAAMKDYARELGLHEQQSFLVSSNGAQIVSTLNWEVVHQTPVEPDLARDVWAIVGPSGYPMQYYEDGKILTSPNYNEFTKEDTRLTNQPLVVVEDFAGALQQPRIKLLVPGDPEGVAVLRDQLRTELSDRANIFTSKPYFLEILHPHADKGHALAWVASRLGITANEILAIGDSHNDLGMLEYAGHPVAMINGVAEVKSIAEYITLEDNNSSGFAEALNRYLGSD